MDARLAGTLPHAGCAPVFPSAAVPVLPSFGAAIRTLFFGLDVNTLPGTGEGPIDRDTADLGRVEEPAPAPGSFGGAPAPSALSDGVSLADRLGCEESTL